jgi:tetratricopeptide (TPR) repeat protein
VISLAAPPRKSSWITSPSIDLIVGCGAWSLPLLILPYLLGGIGQNRALGFYTLALVVNYPHYMATIYRAYRTREDFSRYRIVTLYFTLLLTAVLIAAHQFYALVPWLVTIYLTWSPFHYMGQNFGLMMMFVHRNELKVNRRDRNLLWIAFVASYLLIFLRVHTNPSTEPFVISLGLPSSLLDVLRIPLTVVFFAGMIPLGRLIRQAGAKRKRDSAQPEQWKPMLAPLTLYVTQFLWAVLPTVLFFLNRFGVPQVVYSVSILAIMHCAQYLWITNYYARREAKAESAAWHWQTYFAVLVIGGVALFIPGPWLASYALGRDFAMSVLIFTAVVNIHHFILDGAIWKLRDTRIRSLLTATDTTMTEAASRVWWLPVGRPWRVAGATAIALLVMIAGLDQVRHYLGDRLNNIPSLALAAAMNPHDSIMQIRLGRAYETAGDQARMEHAFREAIRANPDNLEGQNAVAKVLLETGRYDEAYAHYKRMFSRVDPNAEALMNFGALCKQFNRHDEALSSFQRVLVKLPDYAPAHLLLAQMLDADGKTSDAISHYQRYVALTSKVPAQPADREFQNAVARIHVLGGAAR